MGGKVTNAQVLATLAQQKLRDIAATEGHSIVPSERRLAEYLSELGPEEDPFKNRDLESDTRPWKIER